MIHWNKELENSHQVAAIFFFLQQKKYCYQWFQPPPPPKKCFWTFIQYRDITFCDPVAHQYFLISLAKKKIFLTKKPLTYGWLKYRKYCKEEWGKLLHSDVKHISSRYHKLLLPTVTGNSGIPFLRFWRQFKQVWTTARVYLLSLLFSDIFICLSIWNKNRRNPNGGKLFRHYCAIIQLITDCWKCWGNRIGLN